ncbi:MAG: Zn-dependent exopeptidase M28 [Oscillospiraceae bacterium]|nr:Zn-dependent exopeptidase M28 [Oscillospiraceae bacterium]
MLVQSQKILSDFQVRKSKKQKEAFRAWLCGELKAAGYAPKVEEGFAAKNVVVGDPDTAKVIFSAHYDTCAVLPVPNFITPRNIFFYICYQLLLVIPLFLAVAVVEGILLAVIAELHSLVLLPLMPVTSIALCGFFLWWILDGPANKHTANDNTSGVITLLETALAMPEKDREKVCFVFFDNEEKGLFGSAAFTKAHKKAKRETLNINFDCVSDGDSIQFFPGELLKKDGESLRRMEAAFESRGGKVTEVVRGFGFYPSDNKAFKRGVGVCALKRRKVIGYYMDRIHTNKDTVFEEENIALLRDGALRLAAGEKF